MSSETRPDLWVIVLCYNGFALTRECLDSLAAQTIRPHVLVADNASTDGTAGQVAAGWPWVEVLHLEQNRGYAGGNNAAMRYAIDNGARFVFLLNNDTRLAADCIERLQERLAARPRAAAVGPMVYTWDKWETISSAGGEIDWQHADAINVGAGAQDVGQYRVRPVDFLNGCALMVRTEAIVEVGLLDERYFMYWEETDWCQRMRRAGWELWFEPSAKLQHKAPIESSGMSRNALYYMARNRLLFFWTQTPWVRKPLVMLHALHGIARGALRSFAREHSTGIEGQALRDFALHRYGRQVVQSPAAERSR